jgi:protein involved in polysaccharide export with SLBB domain
MTAALFASGGVKPIGSLRNVQLKRQGVVIRTLDLYDLLLKGDTGNDAKLLPGDVIFIPPVSATVAIDGEVRRPAIYELKGNHSVADLIELAGG